MKLTTFGKVHLENSDFSRPKPLLLLAYLTLEGPQDRRKLADLFWRDAKKAKEDKAELQKKLGKLSVVLAQFKKEGVTKVFPDKAGIDPLPSLAPCDALEFLEFLRQGDLKKALELYQGPFLHDLGKPLGDLEVSNEILDWVLEKREYFAEKARSAMLALAEQAHETGNVKEATQWAEKAYGLVEAPELEPAQLSRLQHLLRTTKSDVTKKVDKAVKASLDEISPEAREVFLAMSLQTTPNLTVVREALKRSISELSEMREELLFAGLVDESTVLAQDMAQDWLNKHPAERVPLLMKVVRSTPPEEAFELYRSIYQETKGFGGIGDLQKARKAYYLKAKQLMDAREFAPTVETLSELREVENLHEAEADGQCRFLEAYALERLGRFKEAFALLQTLPEKQHHPDITALRSALLWRLGKGSEAKAAAENVIKNGLEWLWARATATNTLGNLELHYGEFLEAASLFKKSAALFQAAGDKDRWVGSLNNYAVALDMMAARAEEKKVTGEALESLRHDAESAYKETLAVLDQSGDNPLLRAKILLNLGVLWEHRKDLGKAEAYYVEATPFATQANVLDIVARLHLNLGAVYYEQNQYDKARPNYKKALDIATQAGEFSIQAKAIANLAELEDDTETLEIGLALLEQSGQLDSSSFFLEDYKFILEQAIKKAHATGNTSKEQFFAKKLKAISDQADESFTVKETFIASGNTTEVN